MDDLFRVYTAHEIARGKDGYPAEWHQTIKHAVRDQAHHRCVRCGHPYPTGQHKMEPAYDWNTQTTSLVSWSPCDEECHHGAEIRFRDDRVEARARILTVHHLDGDKGNCRWWNLVALCQRCHLTIQGKVLMPRVWPWEHSVWFQPYVAGYYAFVYLGEELTRVETECRLRELLALERAA